MPHSREHLIVFTRYPHPGSTKTRLIPVLGTRGAADLQRHMTEHLAEVLRHPALRNRMRTEIRYEGGDAGRMRRWLGTEFRYRSQGRGDLAQRMERALREAFAAGAGSAVIIGCDIPDITAPLLRQAFDHLGTCNLVLGPARDGGYYLVGLQRMVQNSALPEIFRDIPWGTNRVLGTTLRRACGLRLDFELLAELQDVDRPEDLDVWRAITPKISVVVPTLNESDNLTECLQRIRTGRNLEAIVVDGGSGDATARIARHCGARVLQSSPPRAVQMNVGAAAADGRILMFLHADCRLPEGFDVQARALLRRPGVVAGAFRLKIDSPRVSMRIMEQVANLRAQFLQKPYGDQALFLDARRFARLGGFRQIPIMEDFELVQRLARRGRIALTDDAVSTSPRRWHRLGVWKTWGINQLVVFGYVLGAHPRTLARLYQNATRPKRKRVFFSS